MKFRHATAPEKYQTTFGVDSVLADLVREMDRKPEDRRELLRQVDVWLDRRLQIERTT